MKIAVVTPPNESIPKPALVSDGTVTVRTDGDLSLAALLEKSVESGPQRLQEEFPADGDTVQNHPISEVSFQAPVASRGRLFCLGGAYTSHLRERDRSLLQVPHHWAVPSPAIIGPNDSIRLPGRVAENVKPAVELCVVIGKGGSYIEEDIAYEHIAGYTISNDVTARTDWPGPRGYKIMDTFAPVGPHIVTADEIPNPLDLELEIQQDGEPICTGSTAGHQFTISFLVSFLSTVFNLRPGDVISTGDPGDVTDRLRPGSEVSLRVEDIGTLSNPVRRE